MKPDGVNIPKFTDFGPEFSLFPPIFLHFLSISDGPKLVTNIFEKSKSCIDFFNVQGLMNISYSLLKLLSEGLMQLSKLDECLAGDVAFAAEACKKYHPEGLFPSMIMGKGESRNILEKEMSMLLIVLALHWLLKMSLVKTC